MHPPTPPPTRMADMILLSVLEAFVFLPPSAKLSIIHWVHSPGISPFYSSIVGHFHFCSPLSSIFSHFPLCPDILPSLLLIYFLNPGSPSSYIHFAPSFSGLSLLALLFIFQCYCSVSPHPPSTHDPTRLVRLLSLRTNQHLHHLLYNYASTCFWHYS